MSFFSRLFAKLFGRKKKEQPQEAPRVPYTPTMHYPGIGKFSQPDASAKVPTMIPEQSVLKPLVSTPEPRRAESGFPAGAYEFPQPGSGAWYVPIKLPNRGWEHAGPFTSLEQFQKWIKDVLLRDNNLKEAERLNLFQVHGRGTIPLRNLTVDDWCYLWWKQHDYRLKGDNRDLFRDVCSGSHDEISWAINTADTVNPSQGYWQSMNEQLVAAVEAAFAK